MATPLDLEVFQGPLDLLLQLVERRKLEITEVSLAAVAGQYLQAVRALPEAGTSSLLSEFLRSARGCSCLSRGRFCHDPRWTTRRSQ